MHLHQYNHSGIPQRQHDRVVVEYWQEGVALRWRVKGHSANSITVVQHGDNTVDDTAL